MARNFGNNRNTFGTENYSDHDRASYANERSGGYRNQFYQGERDEGRPRQAQRNTGRFSEEEHLRNANESYGGRSQRNDERGYRASYRPSGDWNGDYDDGTYSSSHEAADVGRDYNAHRSSPPRTYGHTAHGSSYGTGRYEADYEPRVASRSGGYSERERSEYNRFDQDHDDHDYSFDGRSWRAGEGIEPERSHGKLYGSTQGETDHGRSRFRSADEDWHLPTPPHNDEIEQYNRRYGNKAAPGPRYKNRYRDE